MSKRRAEEPTVDTSEALQAIEQIPDWQRKLKAARKPMKLEQLLPGKGNEARRDALKTNGYYDETAKDGTVQRFGAFMSNGYVIATAATVSRNPGKSYDFIKDIEDFKLDTSTKREDKVALYYRIYNNEGIIHNGINTSAALVSTDGNFFIKRAGQGKRPKSKVRDELSILLDWWKDNVNGDPENGVVTSAQGIVQYMEQGTRQALIEGSHLGAMTIRSVNVPPLGKSYKLPIFIQSISTQYLSVPQELEGTGYEIIYWTPPTKTLQAITRPTDPNVKEVIDKAIDPDILAQLKKSRKAKLDSRNLIHLKHRGVDTEYFGESMVEPAKSAIAYMRALQALDFVTIDSIINRIVIIAVGAKEPDSDYHNIETAQARLKVLQQMYGEVGPNMHLLWAGPDIQIIDVGANNKVMELDGRFKVAHERIRTAIGVPQALLDGTGGGSEMWASYEGYREKLRGIQNGWGHNLKKVGQLIADLNGYTEVDLMWQPVQSVLADRTAGANLALQSAKSGYASLRRTVAELGGNFEAERRNRIIEKGLDPDAANLPTDEEIFSPPVGMPGDTRVNPDGTTRSPGADPGRPTNEERAPIKPERDPNNRNPNDSTT